MSRRAAGVSRSGLGVDHLHSPRPDRTGSRRPLACDPLPAGPRTSPVRQLMHYSHSPLPYLEGCARRHGDLFTARWAGYGTFVMLADPEAVRDVFRGDGDALHSGEANAFAAVMVGGTSVLVLDGPPHARMRRVLLPPMKGERMLRFADSMRADALDEVRTWKPGQPIKLIDPMQRITLRTILRATLGLDPGPTLSEFERLVWRVMELTHGRHGLILLKVLPVGWLTRNRYLSFHRRVHALDVALYAFLAERRAVPAADRVPCVLTDLLAATHDDGRPLSDVELRDALFTMLFAGHDTTAVALAWALEQILPRPDVLERIAADGEPYLDAVVRESLRVRTVLPFAVRLTKTEFTAGGRTYPPGVVLCPCSHLVHRRPDLYPDPGRFRPERFLERKFAANEWFPFGGGTRMCLGLTFALFQMKVVLGTLLEHVRLKRVGRSRPIRRGIALAPDDGVRAVVTG